MYKVTIVNNDVETLIHSPYSSDIKLETGTIKKEINKIDSFNMTFFLNNPACRNLKPFKTFVKVTNTQTNQVEFEGRVLQPNKDMDNEGLVSHSYECEGELGYLHDSQQKHLEFRGTPKQLFNELISYHNSQVEDYKRFEIGVMETTTTTDNVYFYLSAEKSTFEEIDDKILGRIGGELQIRKENGVRYLDVLKRLGEHKSTNIQIAKNLRSVSQSIDPTDIVTRLTPLGNRIESEDETATDASEARLTVESVNNGLPYIDREDLIAEFGIQGGSKTWDDITLPSRLLSTAKNWINAQKTALYQYDISALDLSLIGLDIDNFDLGNSHTVINPIMNIDEELRIIGKTTDINSPQEASLKIGDKFKSLNEYQADANKSQRKIVNLENTVERQSKRLSLIQTEMNNVDTIIADLNKAIGDADIPALELTISNLNDAVSNLTDAVDSIPIYSPATEIKDGLMSYVDKAKLNRITVLNQTNLDAIKNKLDLISVTQAIDLNKLYQDVEVLKNA